MSELAPVSISAQPPAKWEQLRQIFEYDPKAYPECVQHERDWTVGMWPHRTKYLLLIHRRGDDLDITAVHRAKDEWVVEKLKQ